jgi:hypothetical protein
MRTEDDTNRRVIIAVSTVVSISLESNFVLAVILSNLVSELKWSFPQEFFKLMA